MNEMKKIIQNFLILFSITALLFALEGILTNTNNSYQQQHLTELTITKQVGEAVYYEYKNTPYTIIANVFFYIYLIIPAIFVIYFSIAELRETKNFLQSLLYPLLFIPFTFLLFSKLLSDSIGGEAAIGLILITAYTGTILSLTVIINSIIYFSKKY